MSIKSKVFSDSLVTAVRSILSVIRGFIIIPLITNLLGAGSYGIWTTILALTSIISSTGSFYLPGALIRYGSRDQRKENTYIDIMTFVFVISLIIFILLFFIGRELNISSFLNGEISNETQIVFVASLLVSSSMIWSINLNFPRAKGNVISYEFLYIVLTVIEIIGLAFVFLSGGSIIYGLLLLSIIRLTLSTIIFIAIIRLYSIPKPSIKRYQRYFKYSIPMVPTVLSDRLLINTDKYLILYFLSPTMVGIYAVAHQISSVIGQITEVLESTLYPTVAKAWDEGKKEEISELFNDILRGYIILVIPAMAGLILLAKPLLTLISTEEIAFQGVTLIPVLLIGFAAKGGYQALKKILTASEETNKIATATLLGMFLNIVLNVLLIPYIGLVGAAGASAISFIFILLLIYKYADKQINLPIPYGSVSKSIISTIIMVGFLMMIPTEMMYLDLLVYPPVGFIIYSITLIMIGEFSSEELSYIKQLLP